MDFIIAWRSTTVQTPFIVRGFVYIEKYQQQCRRTRLRRGDVLLAAKSIAAPKIHARCVGNTGQWCTTALLHHHRQTNQHNQLLLHLLPSQLQPSLRMRRGNGPVGQPQEQTQLLLERSGREAPLQNVEAGQGSPNKLLNLQFPRLRFSKEMHPLALLHLRFCRPTTPML